VEKERSSFSTKKGRVLVEKGTSTAKFGGGQLDRREERKNRSSTKRGEDFRGEGIPFGKEGHLVKNHKTSSKERRLNQV